MGSLLGLCPILPPRFVEISLAVFLNPAYKHTNKQHNRCNENITSLAEVTDIMQLPYGGKWRPAFSLLDADTVVDRIVNVDPSKTIFPANTEGHFYISFSYILCWILPDTKISTLYLTLYNYTHIKCVEFLRAKTKNKAWLFLQGDETKAIVTGYMTEYMNN